MGNKKEIAMDERLYFRIHVPNFLKEIANNNKLGGVLIVPLNTLRIYLGKVAERASELNDPKLNLLMCEMSLYEVADPESKEFDPDIIKKLKEEIKKQQS